MKNARRPREGNFFLAPTLATWPPITRYHFMAMLLCPMLSRCAADDEHRRRRNGCDSETTQDALHRQ